MPSPRRLLTPCAATQTVLAWPTRRLIVALAGAGVTVLVVAIPTALIPNPVFGREIAPEPWAWPTLWVTAALSGLLLATYVRLPGEVSGEERGAAAHASGGAPGPGGTTAPGGTSGTRGPGGEARAGERLDPPGRAGAVGGLLGFLAVGCPVCNKIALLALGYTGALQWFAPLQPWLAVAGIALLAYALSRRLATEATGVCAVAPGRPTAARRMEAMRAARPTAGRRGEGQGSAPDAEASSGIPADAVARSAISASTDEQPPSQ